MSCGTRLQGRWSRREVSDQPKGLPPYMGTAEVAEFLHVSKQVINNWMKRGRRLPTPCAVLKMGPIWKTDDIMEFSFARSRARREKAKGGV